MESTNIINLMDQLKRDVNDYNSYKAKWKIDKTLLEIGDAHISYPDIIKTNFYTVYMHVLHDSKDFSVFIRFIEQKIGIEIIDDEDDAIESDHVLLEWIGTFFVMHYVIVMAIIIK